ncbi:MAG: TadE family protein [Candidatus Korobacteraceae bacterium]
MESNLQRSSRATTVARRTAAPAREQKSRFRWISGTSGNAITEFALVFPLFVLMMCAVVDISRLLYMETTLQNAVRVGGRYAITGNHQPDPLHSGQTLSRVNSIIAVAQQAAIGLNVSNIQVSSVVGGSGSAGGPGDTVTVALTSNVKLLTPIIAHFFSNGALSFTVSSTFKNEWFPPGQTT